MPALKEKQEQEIKLWRRWQSGDTAALGPLMKSYEPMVQSWMNKLRLSPLPPIFIETEIKKQILDSFDRYDPNRGAKLSTYVTSRLPKVLRNTVYQYSNLGKIPEERQRSIWTFQNSKDRLEETLKRPPTAMELAAELSWDLPQVERLERELRPKRLLSEEGDFSFNSDATEQKVLRYVYMSLPAPHQTVFEHHFGWAGKPRLNDGDLATHMKVEVKKVKAMKKDVAEKIEKALQVIT